MYNDTTLIVVGDSFVYGQLGDDAEINSCHQRSWVSRLKRIAGFKEAVNLGSPGASNTRSFRTLFEYLDKKHDFNEKYLIMFCVSELSRIEIPVNKSVAAEANMHTHDPFFEYYESDLRMSGVGTWTLKNPNLGDSVFNYIETYYKLFDHDEYHKKILRNSLFSLKSVIDSLNIEFYVASSICPMRVLNDMSFLNKKLPILEFIINGKSMNITEAMQAAGFKRYPCGHGDEHAHEFIANHIFKYYLKREDNDIQGS